jgi:hypothetical protein
MVMSVRTLRFASSTVTQSWLQHRFVLQCTMTPWSLRALQRCDSRAFVVLSAGSYQHMATQLLQSVS